MENILKLTAVISVIMLLISVLSLTLISRLWKTPGYSCCERCGYSWNKIDTKSVMTSNRSGTFATCTACWNKSSLIQLKKYYTAVYKSQEASPGVMDHSLEHLLECVEKEYNKEKSKK